MLLTTTLSLSHEVCENQGCSQQCCAMPCAHLEEIPCSQLKRLMRKGYCISLCLKFLGPCVHTLIQMEHFPVVSPRDAFSLPGARWSLLSFQLLWSWGQCPLFRANVVVSQPYPMEGVLTLQTNTVSLITHTVQYHS